MTYDCPGCNKSAYPTFVMNDAGRLIVQCANIDCNYLDPTKSPADFNETVAAVPVAGAAVAAGWAGKKRVVVSKDNFVAARPPVLGEAPAPQALASSHALAQPPARSPADVLAWIDERATWLATEEARLAGVVAEAKAKQAGLAAERRQLERMLKVSRRQAATATHRTEPSLSAEYRAN